MMQMQIVVFGDKEKERDKNNEQKDDKIIVYTVSEV